MNVISQRRLRQLQRMIQSGTADLFYRWPEWEHTRAAVLALDHQECQICKAKHRYRKAVLVHHVQHLKDRPDLALSVTDPDTGTRQLISLCRACHELQHPERMAPVPACRAEPVTQERWD